MDNEIITEDQFLSNIDEQSKKDDPCDSCEKDNIVLDESDQIDILDQLDIKEFDCGSTVEVQQRMSSKDVEDLDTLFTPTMEQAKSIVKSTKVQTRECSKKMRKIAIAPGEMGEFKNWKEDIYIEEKCFPELFPYGCGGYLSSFINDSSKDMGLAAYCISQIMSADYKFRQNTTYLIFLLLVKESIILKRCISTFLRQARRLPNLNKKTLSNLDKADLVRYNQGYKAFKKLRGSAPYYEDAKKNVMALIRQNGCPTIFLTLSCTEFDWPELLKEVAETVYRRKILIKEIEEMSDKEKRKLISENHVQTTLHFQKRVEKLFSIVGYTFFKVGEKMYHVSSYFF